MPQPKRKVLVKSAQYWFDKAQVAREKTGDPLAYDFLMQAFNHTENALASAIKGCDDQWRENHKDKVIIPT